MLTGSSDSVEENYKDRFGRHPKTLSAERANTLRVLSKRRTPHIPLDGAAEMDLRDVVKCMPCRLLLCQEVMIHATCFKRRY